MIYKFLETIVKDCKIQGPLKMALKPVPAGTEIQIFNKEDDYISFSTIGTASHYWDSEKNVYWVLSEMTQFGDEQVNKIIAIKVEEDLLISKSNPVRGEFASTYFIKRKNEVVERYYQMGVKL